MLKQNISAGSGRVDRLGGGVFAMGGITQRQIELVQATFVGILRMALSIGVQACRAHLHGAIEARGNEVVITLAAGCRIHQR